MQAYYEKLCEIYSYQKQLMLFNEMLRHNCDAFWKYAHFKTGTKSVAKLTSVKVADVKIFTRLWKLELE